MSTKILDSLKERRKKQKEEWRHIANGIRMILFGWEKLPSKSKFSFGGLITIGLIVGFIAWVIYPHWQSLVCVGIAFVLVFIMEAGKLSKLKEKAT